LPRNSKNDVTLFTAITLKTFSSNSMKASFAELQKFVPLMAISK